MPSLQERQAYVQVNPAGEVRSGRSTISVRSHEGRLQLVDSWEWDWGGEGLGILEEVPAPPK